VPRHPSDPKLTDYLERYTRGWITLTELFCTIAKRAADDNIEQFFANCPDELRKEFELMIADYGEDEAAWPRTFCIETWIPGNRTNDVNDQHEREQKEIWDGVRILKQRIEKR